MVVGAVNSWICGSEPELAPALRHRAQLLVGGVRQLGSQRPYPS
jgi:hypothetical protein